MTEESFFKMISTPGAVAIALFWLHSRLKNVELRLDMLATHMGAPKPEKKSRAQMTLFAWLLIALLSLSACSVIGKSPSAPGSVERRVFDVETNFVPRVVLQTNAVSVTNVVTEFRTNEVGVIVTRTNELIVPRYNLITVTQAVETYTLTPNAASIATAQSVGGVVNAFAPGIGTALGGALIGLLAAWGKLRSTKRVGTVLAQNIETVREFLKTLPNGAQYDSVITQVMQKHQVEAGVVNDVIAILERSVSNETAQGSVVEIRNALEALKGAK